MHSKRPLDSIDWKILRELQQDGRLSYNVLGQRVGLSPPAVAERVHRLEGDGVIAGYGAQVDNARIGLPQLAFILLKCRPGKCLLEHASMEEFPEILEIHKLGGEHCTLLKVAVSSMKHLDAFNARLARRGTVTPYVVISTPVRRRAIDWEHPAEGEPPAIPGWTEEQRPG